MPRGGKGNRATFDEARAEGTNKDKKLSAMQRSFVDFYLIHWNASKAAKLAGYAESNHGQTGHSLLKDARIKALIEERLAEIKADYRKTHEALTAFYLNVLYTNMDEFIEMVAVDEGDPAQGTIPVFKQSAVLQGGKGMLINEMSIDRGGKVQIKVFSKQAAAEMLNRHVGYYEADNKQKTPKGVAIYLPDNERGDGPEEGEEDDEDN